MNVFLSLVNNSSRERGRAGQLSDGESSAEEFEKTAGLLAGALPPQGQGTFLPSYQVPT